MGFDGSARNELVFRIFQNLVIGGSMSQEEVKVDAYLDVTRAAYRDFLTVHRNPSTGGIEFACDAFSAGSCPGLFTTRSPHNSCLIIVDHIKRRAIVWHKSFVPWW